MPRGRLGPCRPSDMLFSASFGGLHDQDPYRYQSGICRDPNLSASASRPAPGTVDRSVVCVPGSCEPPRRFSETQGESRTPARRPRDEAGRIQRRRSGTADPGLLRIVARAHNFQERLMLDPDLTVLAIASQERLTIGYLSRVPRDASLSPSPKMLTPKCRPRDFCVRARENSTKNHLCCFKWNLRDRNLAKIRGNSLH